MKHTMTKTYGAEQGLSCCFRQWRATSHCNMLHGYAIAVTLKFGAQELDSRNWVVDFGALKEIKGWLQETFDHTTLIAADDPMLGFFKNMHDHRLINLLVLEDGVGCERFAQYIAGYIRAWIPLYNRALLDAGITPPEGLSLLQVEVREHGANAASYVPGYSWQGMGNLNEALRAKVAGQVEIGS